MAKSTFDERLSKLPFFDGIERLQKLQGKNKVIALGSSGTMGSGIVKTITEAGSGILMQDINLEAIAISKTGAHKGHAKAVKARKLSESQQKYINRAGLIGPPIVFNQKEPFSQIAEAHKSGGRVKAEEIVKDFLDIAVTNEKVKEDYKEAKLVIEAGPEILSFKQNIFEFFDLVFKNGSILASNTSSLRISEIAQRVDSPQNVVGFHFFYPADRNALLEIIATEKTDLAVIEAMRQLAYAMGKEPIVCWSDPPGAVANRILVGVLNEAAKIAEEGDASIELIDQAFLETFYEKQIGVKTKKAQAQFQEAPKLGFFKDEVSLYKKIKDIGKQIKTSTKEKNSKKLIAKLLNKKKVLIEQAAAKLNQKRLYALIVENHARLGKFFTPSNLVKEVKEKAAIQLSNINSYLERAKDNKDVLINKFEIEPYKLTEYKGEKLSKQHKEKVSKRLKAAYMAIAIKILNEKLASAHDIEIACKQGFKWNTGPFELVKRLGIPHATKLIAENLKEDPASDETGIALPGEDIMDENLSGVRCYIQDGIGFLEIGRLHIQNLQLTQNSLDPTALSSIKRSIQELQTKGIKILVIKSQGGGVFCAGADLNYAQSVKDSPDKLREFVMFGKEVIQLIHNSSLVTVAVINGPAVGGGAELACACDYRIMVNEESYIAFPEIGLGLMPEWMGTEYFPSIVGKELAKAMICNVRNPLKVPKLTSSDAEEVGFADAVVNRSELYSFLANILKGNEPKIDLSKKLQRNNFDKNDYSKRLNRKFGLEKGFKHIGFLPSSKKRIAKLAEKFIDNSHDPEYAITERNKGFYKRLQKSFVKADKGIQFFIRMAQSKFWAPIFERLGIL